MGPCLSIPADLSRFYSLDHPDVADNLELLCSISIVLSSSEGSWPPCSIAWMAEFGIADGRLINVIDVVAEQIDV